MRMMLPAAACLLLIGLAGCQNDPVKAPFPGQPDLLPAHAYPQIVVTDGLDEVLGFGRPNVQAGPDQPMSVTIPVRVMDDYAYNTQYRFEFFGRDGRELQPKMDWKYERLPARVQVFMRGAALDTGAVDWRLQVRSAR